MTQDLELPKINIDRDESKFLLAIRLFEEGKVSLGESSGNCRIFYEDIDLEMDIANA